jgi:hypothetical protein
VIERNGWIWIVLIQAAEQMGSTLFSEQWSTSGRTAIMTSLLLRP